MVLNPIEAAVKQIKEHSGLPLQGLDDMPESIPRISSGSLVLDLALGGGMPRGRIIEIYGTNGGGKTTLALATVASAQKEGGCAAFIDAEHALSLDWAKKLGVDPKKIHIGQPDSGDQALEAVIKAAELNVFDVIVVDSVASLVPKEELENAIGDQTVALQARLMSRALRELVPVIGKSKTVAIFINQTRKAPMVMYGNPNVTPGGEALKFYSSIRIDVRKESKSERFNSNKDTIGHNIVATIVKNKTAPPFREAIIPINYDCGILQILDFVEAVKSRGLFNFSGGVKYHGEAVPEMATKKFGKWEEFTDFVADPENAEIVNRLREEVKTK